MALKAKAVAALVSLLRTLLIIGLCYVILFPLFSKLSPAVMERRDLFDQTVRWIPRHPTLENFRVAFVNMSYGRAFLGSFVLSSSVSLLQLLVCTAVGYGFARFRFAGSGLLFWIAITTLVVPPQMMMLPLYLNFRYFNPLGLLPEPGINLMNTHWPFILLSLTGNGLRNGLFIFIMRQFFRGMPRELEDAAYVDGAGALKTFSAVMLPGAIPALVIVFLFSFVWQWNDYFYSGMLMSNSKILPVMLDKLAMATVGTDVEAHMHYVSLINNAGSLLFMAPLLVLYVFMQRYFVESIERTGLVG
jgi:multiple sugar transport system permease protein